MSQVVRPQKRGATKSRKTLVSSRRARTYRRSYVRRRRTVTDSGPGKTKTTRNYKREKKNKGGREREEGSGLRTAKKER